jgi:hypothetical protein
MSAITIHIEQHVDDDPEDRNAPMVCPTGVDGPELAAPRSCYPSVEQTHGGLTRSVWIRRSIEDALNGRKVTIIDGAAAGKLGDDRAKLFFHLDPPFPKEALPWSRGTADYEILSMLSTNSKMACPTWDLPAGSPLVGGSCPGATAGQTIVPLEVREKINAQAQIGYGDAPGLYRGKGSKKLLYQGQFEGGDLGRSQVGPVGEPVRVTDTICQICYAEGGNYATVGPQLRELVCYWWSREMLKTRRGTDEWISTMVRAIQGLSWEHEEQVDPRTGKQIYPVRVHSAGDFFSPAYTEAWLHVAARVPEIYFWAPTRTWAAQGWMGTIGRGGEWRPGHWAKMINSPGIPDNFAIRPSAYHVNDSAPGKDDYPWDGPYQFPTAGTTSLYDACAAPSRQLLQARRFAYQPASACTRQNSADASLSSSNRSRGASGPP